MFGGEKGIRTPGTVITVHMISNHAPSASSDISPNTADYYNKYILKNQVIFFAEQLFLQLSVVCLNNRQNFELIKSYFFDIWQKIVVFSLQTTQYIVLY